MTAPTGSDDVSVRSSGETGDLQVGESLPQRELRALVGGCCRDCGTHYSAREAVVSIFLGLKDAPRCLPCVSRRLERDAQELWSDLLAHIPRR
jgi:hypothetical protein